ncbi:MAG TPA: hypothetical protein VJB16_04370 [archaeon]|nr:hypothetical protein [archaeon]
MKEGLAFYYALEGSHCEDARISPVDVTELIQIYREFAELRVLLDVYTAHFQNQRATETRAVIAATVESLERGVTSLVGSFVEGLTSIGYRNRPSDHPRQLLLPFPE